MGIKTVATTLLYTTIVSVSSAETSLTTESYAPSKAANAYRGDPVELDFFTAPSADWSMSSTLALQALVTRFTTKSTAVKFNPSQSVERGSGYPPGCRKPDNSDPEVLRAGCEMHCMNYGRYCSLAAAYGKNKENPNLKGSDAVAEVARRECVWELYGQANSIKFFQYHQAMKATKCNNFFTKECVEEALTAVGMDFTDVDKCMNGESGLGPTINKDNHHLEEAITVGNSYELKELPALHINGKIFDDFTNSGKLLIEVCNEFPSNHKPAVCDFCNSHCPERTGDKLDADLCLWELKCTDGFTFDQYLNATGRTEADVVNKAYEEDEDPVWLYITLAVIGACIACVLGIGFLMYRSWRDQRIIDRYIKEQLQLAHKDYEETERRRNSMNRNAQALGVEATKAGAGGTDHQDPLFFPEDDLDWDVEPGLQYRDHIDTIKNSQQGERVRTAAAPKAPPAFSFLKKVNPGGGLDDSEGWC